MHRAPVTSPEWSLDPIYRAGLRSGLVAGGEGWRAPMPAIDSAVDTGFDWFSPEVIRDPQKYDGMIREAGPVVYSPQYDVWATGRHNQIELMMRDWRTFSSTRPPFEEIGQPMILLSDDPPDHQRVRTVISKGMSPAVLRRMQEAFETEAENTVRQLLDAPGGLVDGHTELSKAYVLKVFPDAIGLGDANREMLIKFGHAQFNMFGPKNDIYRESMEAAVEVFEWVARNCKRDAVQPGGVCMAMYEAADAGMVTQEDAEILILHMPGGRDPRRWENPGTYDITRDVVGKHLGLGFGVHACVGARMARLEGVSLLSALARHVASIELAGEPEVTTNMAVHGHEALPLRIVPA